MATITKPMALDESFNTTETTPRNIADVLAEMGEAIAQGMGRTANEVAYDNTTSGLSADDVQEAVDELAEEKVDKVTGKGLSTNDYTNEEKASVANSAEQLRSTQTATGNPITLTDAAPINAESLVVELEPKQDLHGQSAPYVGGAGKNKLPSPSAKSVTYNNVTFSTDGNGNYSIVGTPQGGEVAYADFDIDEFICPSNTDYKFCFFNSQAIATVVLRFYYDSTLLEYWGLGPVNKELSDFGQAQNQSVNKIRLVVPSGTSIDMTLSPMICLKTESSTFAPYSNICPITGYDECEVESVGFNQWDEEVESGDYNPNTGEKRSDSARFRSKNPIMCFANTNYYFRHPSNSDNAYIIFFDANNNFISSKYCAKGGTGTNSPVFTTPTNAMSFGFFVWASSAVTYNNDICINISKTEGTPKNGDYVPYHSSNATIQFGQTVYGGRSNFTDGGTDKTHKCIDMGDLTYSVQSGAYSDMAIITGLAQEIKIREHDVINFMCSGYRPSDLYEWHVNGAITIGNVFGGNFVNICNSDFIGKTNEQVKAMMTGLQFYYEIVTPENISTPPADLKLLQGTNHITTNGTTITLGYQPDNVIGDVKGEIEKITEMPYLRILDNDVDTEVKNYRLYYRLISSSYTLVNLAEMLQHRFLFVEVIQNPSGTANHTLLHSALIDPRTIDGFEYQMKAGTGDTVIIKLNIDESKFDLSVRYTGTHTSGDPTDYYVTIRLVD